MAKPHTDETSAIDPALLATGQVPADLPLDGRQLIFLWQPPTSATIDRLSREHRGVPILVGRFDAETGVEEHHLPYWSAADFFSTRTLVDLELATYEARDTYRGPAIPTYLGMPLFDGDLPRMRAWHELVACAATLMLIRQAAPRTEVLTDWMGAKLAGGVGLGVRQLWRANLADPNWPARRWLRERLAGRNQATRSNSDIKMPLYCSAEGGPAPGEGADIVVLLAGWVERRFLESFPIELLAEAGYRCLLLVHRRIEALEELVRRAQVRCEQIDYPAAAADMGSLKREVAGWCQSAVEAGYFAPLRGRFAQRVVGLMGWPRWAPKLVAMHRLLTAVLERERPALLLAPAEKDWGPYCGHHAARRLGIPSVGFKHASWLAGSDLDRLERGLYLPTPATHILAYTPGDAEAFRQAGDLGQDTVIWRGNPRVDKSQVPPPVIGLDVPVRILVGARGMGPGRTMYLRRSVIPWNVRFISALFERLGDRVRVRLHPWDSPANYPDHLGAVFLPRGEALESQLAEYAALATTYSTIALDAAAAGRPVFLWDHERLNLDRSEIASVGGAVISCDLGEVCAAALRFVEDAGYRQALCCRAGRFPEHLRATLPDPAGSPGTQLVDWLASLIGARSRTTRDNRASGATRSRVIPELAASK